ncbi:MAG TPA: septum formation initiator family protein [Acidisphaera sp.]|nr:septum formation initiator family protein [Acidisphaera sp.]
MAIGRVLKRRVRAALPPVIFLALTAYFGWSATQGDRGLKAYAQRQQLLQQAQLDQAKAEADRDGWERRVAGLRNNHIDRDTLDERARAMLNMTQPSDIIISYGQSDRVF